MSSNGHRKYSDLVDISKLQALLQSFSEVIGVANAVIDMDGVVLVQSGWQDACTAFHRANARSCRRCIESDTVLAASMMQGEPYAVYRCHNGLIEAAARVIVDGEHVANVFAGQFLTEPADIEFFRQQADQFGYDETSYLQAISRVPVLSLIQVESVTRLYAKLAGLLADNGLDRLRELQTAGKLAELNKVLEDKVAARTQALAKANEDLAAREVFLKQILDTSSVAIFLVDMTGRITQANQRMAEMFGWPIDALEGSEYVALVHPSERELGRQKMLALLGSDITAVDLERRYWRANHTEFWGHLTGQRFYDASGCERGLIGVIADISKRRQAEEALRIAATAFESQEGMFVTDASNVILRVNTAFTEITGYAADEVVGSDPRLLMSGHHDAVFFAAIWGEIARTGSWHGEIWNRRKSGEVHPYWLTITAVRNTQDEISNYVATLTDITARKTAEDEIQNLAFYDPLTRLPNRRLLMDRLEQALAAGSRHHRRGALLFVDLDDFKTLNDALGHDKGDLLLQQVANRLASCTREGDTVARLGGDEFVVLLEDLSENPLEAATQAEVVGEKILAALSQTFPLAGHELRSTSSIGVTLFGERQETIDEPLKRADLAMYQAKAAGRNTLRFFDPQMQAVVEARAALEMGLHEALANKQFVLHYQAQVAGECEIVGAEALVRWQHPQRGTVAPADFIALAEETGLILPLGQWVLETACAQLALWADRAEMAHLTVAVNVSARQFHQRNFVKLVLAALERTGANPRRLKLELTESLLVADIEGVITKMSTLKEVGVGFSLDDFGTGYSSLSYLKRLPLDQLKIDQGFVRDILIDPNDAAIAKMVIALATSLGLAVIAEGVETEAQRVFLAGQGCHAYQGYLFSRPLPLQEFTALVGRT